MYVGLDPREVFAPAGGPEGLGDSAGAVVCGRGGRGVVTSGGGVVGGLGSGTGGAVVAPGNGSGMGRLGRLRSSATGDLVV